MLKDKLKEFRTLCDLSQQQVASLLNIHRSTYSYYESGKTEPSLDNIRSLSRIFGVSLNDLLEIDAPSASVVHDPADGKEDTLRIGDLTRDEKMLVMRYRLLTRSQRSELLAVMLTPEDRAEEDD